MYDLEEGDRVITAPLALDMLLQRDGPESSHMNPSQRSAPSYLTIPAFWLLRMMFAQSVVNEVRLARRDTGCMSI